MVTRGPHRCAARIVDRRTPLYHRNPASHAQDCVYKGRDVVGVSITTFDMHAQKESPAAAKRRYRQEKINSSDPEVVAWHLATLKRENERQKAKRAAETPEQREERLAKRRRQTAERNRRRIAAEMERMEDVSQREPTEEDVKASSARETYLSLSWHSRTKLLPIFSSVPSHKAMNGQHAGTSASTMYRRRQAESDDIYDMEKRQIRLAKERARQRARLRAETEEEREARLVSKRESERARRKRRRAPEAARASASISTVDESVSPLVNEQSSRIRLTDHAIRPAQCVFGADTQLQSSKQWPGSSTNDASSASYQENSRTIPHPGCTTAAAAFPGGRAVETQTDSPVKAQERHAVGHSVSVQASLRAKSTGVQVMFKQTCHKAMQTVIRGVFDGR
ncbi:uncharacterized protein LOC144101328 isoform X2 [Amblyomma americanum]